MTDERVSIQTEANEVQEIKSELTETEVIETPEAEEKKPIIPRKQEWILAGLVIAAAYLYTSFFPGFTSLSEYLGDHTDLWRGIGVAAFLMVCFSCLFLGTGLWYAWKRQIKPDRSSWLYFGFTAAAVLWFIVFMKTDQDIAIFMLMFLHGVAVYWLLVLTGSRSKNCLDERVTLDLARGFFAIPFSNFGSIFGAMGNWIQYLFGRREQKSRKLIQVCLGALMSIPVLCIVIPLLMNADDSFEYLLGNIVIVFDEFFMMFNPFQAWFNTIFVLFISCYLFGLFYGAFHKEAPKPVSRKLPRVMLDTFLGIFLVVYALFFAAKLSGVSGAMEQIEEGTLLTSTYARSGFFELCRIAAINLVMFSFVKWYASSHMREIRVMLSILGIQTLGFIGLAFSKMGLYISIYGLTFKRVFTSWFMIVLFVAFSLLIAENWKKFNAVRISVIFGCITFLLLAYSNMPVWIAS